MGYTPNAMAIGLQTSRSGTIGLAVTSLADPFFGDLIEGVDEVAAAAGLSVFVTASRNDPEAEMKVVETFHRRRVDGIIVSSSQLSDRHAGRLERIRVPVVLVNQHAEMAPCMFHSVGVDEFAGAWAAARHLLALGHRRIGYLGLGNRLRSNEQRLAGYRAALAEAGLEPAPSDICQVPAAEVIANDDYAAGRNHLRHLLAAGVTAVFCYNDRTAVGALMACREGGVAVPGDCSLVGFDDIEMAGYVTPALTTVRQPKREMGRRAMEMVLRLLAGESVENQLFAPELIVRASTGGVERIGQSASP
jgi:LacI family transcriptional regulator/LacI family repressor for deo operon, udp, cdd, tsx, nupC, and nupG